MENALGKDLTRKIVGLVLERFPCTKAIIDFSGHNIGSSQGDIDIIIVVDKIPGAFFARKKLDQLRKSVGEIDLDAALTSKDHLGDLLLVTAHKKRYAHGMDRYRIKNHSRMIYGSRKILKFVKPITLDDALRDILPYVRKNAKSMKREIKGKRNIASYIDKNKPFLNVVMRNIYTIETGKLTSKQRAMEYAGRKYAGTYPLVRYLKDDKEYDAKNLMKSATALLDMVEKIIGNFLKS